MTAPDRLSLSSVTLCAITSVNVEATLHALERCLAAADFARCLLFTDWAGPMSDPRIERVQIAPIASSRAYSQFVLRQVAPLISTDHALFVQWDGFIIDPACWRSEFLEQDYIGAVWPQFTPEWSVGNGGFSLRSRRLLQACLDPDFVTSHPEDLAICHDNRALLQDRHGIRFAEPELARHFSHERGPRMGPSFGFHGVFNLPAVIGTDGFWDTYRLLDDRSTTRTDLAALMWQVARGRRGARRALAMLLHNLQDLPEGLFGIRRLQAALVAWLAR